MCIPLSYSIRGKLLPCTLFRASNDGLETWLCDDSNILVQFYFLSSRGLPNALGDKKVRQIDVRYGRKVVARQVQGKHETIITCSNTSRFDHACFKPPKVEQYRHVRTSGEHVLINNIHVMMQPDHPPLSASLNLLCKWFYDDFGGSANVYSILEKIKYWITLLQPDVSPTSTSGCDIGIWSLFFFLEFFISVHKAMISSGFLKHGP